MFRPSVSQQKNFTQSFTQNCTQSFTQNCTQNFTQKTAWGWKRIAPSQGGLVKGA